MLRGILEQDERVFISLDEELSYVKTYLDIERVRFEDRMSVAWNIESTLSSLQVPMLMLQTLAENAVKHGVGKTSHSCEIKIEAAQYGDFASLVISDNGPGVELDEEEMMTNGIGLRNVRERLKEIYRDQYQMKIDTGLGNGFRIELILPKHHQI